MPEERLNSAAIAELDALLQGRWPGSSRLTEAEAKARFPNRLGLRATWKLPGAVATLSKPLLVSVDGDFPWTLPRISLADPTNGISYPHVETDGQICIAPSSAVYELPVGLRHIEALVEDAALVMERGSAGANDEDFFAEAHSYWGLVEPSAGSFLLLGETLAEHSLCSAASCGAHVVVGKTANEIVEWSRRAQQSVGVTEQAIVLWLSAPLHPRDYPLTPRDFVTFCEEVGAADVLRQALLRWKFRAPLRAVIAFPYKGDRVFLGAEIATPQSVRVPGALQAGTPGFRPSAKGASARIGAISRNPSRFKHWRAIPIHRGFLRERTAGRHAEPLQHCHVVVIGCGALGGQLAVQLAQAGVGRLTLLDADVMDWRNVGRHVLDGASVGQNKALALKDAILRRFPDADVSAFSSSWEKHASVAPEIFENADLLISATAEAASNRHLDALSKSGDFAPVVFGWMEPFAVCSHAVLRYPGGAGLSDITDDCGILIEPVVDLATAPPLPQEPSCGAFFQPYSSLSALACVSLVAELAVDALLGRIVFSTARTWVGTASAFQDNHLSLTSEWHQRLNRMGFSRLYDRPIHEVAS